MSKNDRRKGLPVSIQHGELAGLDAIAVDALVLPLYALRAQPLGVAGYVDWRLSGRIGRLIRSGRFAGAEREALLMSALGRVGAQRIFLFGLGPPRIGSPVERQQEMAWMLEILADAKVRDFGIAPPMVAEPLRTPSRPPAEGPPPLPTTPIRVASPEDIVSGWLASPAIAEAHFARMIVLDSGEVLSNASSRIVPGCSPALEW